MADSKDTTSFFRKVVKFVASPNTEWGELGSTTSGVRDSDFAKSELKAMIERKRRNDFVRKREFDMLRKVRREGLTGDQLASLEGSSRIDESDDRVDGNAKPNEVKAKIDEIEQQMVGEGLSGLPRRNSGFYTAPTEPAKLDTDLAPLTKTLPLALDTTHAAAQPPASIDQLPRLTQPIDNGTVLGELELVPLGETPWEKPASGPAPTLPLLPTEEFPLPLQSESPADEVPPAPPLAVAQAPDAFQPTAEATDLHLNETGTPASAETDPTGPPPQPNQPANPMKMPMIGGSLSNYDALMAIEVNQIDHDPVLDEAVIAFANADFALCEHALITLTSPEGQRDDHAETWLTLFDLYRAIGDQAKFEGLALDYARQFSLSSPQWFSMPKMIAEASPQEDKHPNTQTVSTEMDSLGWVCPARLDEDAVIKLRSTTLQMPLPWVFDWADLTEMEPRACASLIELFLSWMDQSLTMRWLGGEQLFKVLADATAAGSRDTDPVYWKARFAALRLTDQVHQFDEVAIDYCVTYEVSPPSWEPAQCRVHVSGSEQSALSHPLSSVSEISTSFVESKVIEEAGLIEMASLELFGQLVGDIGPTLSRLDAQLGSAPIVSVACGNLIRVDFIAAGDLLNWVLSKRNENRSVIFSDAHRLIALFFSAMGIHEHAKVKIRTS